MCKCGGLGMYPVVKKGDRGQTMVVCDCPAGYRRRAYLELNEAERRAALRKALRDRRRKKRVA